MKTNFNISDIAAFINTLLFICGIFNPMSLILAFFMIPLTKQIIKED